MKLNNHIKLINIGNTCYLNAIIQSLLNLDLFRKYLIQYNNNFAKDSILYYLFELIENNNLNNKNFIAEILKLIILKTKNYEINKTKPFNKIIELNKQNDAFDILSVFLQIFYEETKKLSKITVINKDYLNNIIIENNFLHNNDLNFLWIYKYILHKKSDISLKKIDKSKIIEKNEHIIYNSELFNLFEVTICDIMLNNTTQFLFTPIIELDLDKFNIMDNITLEIILSNQDTTLDKNNKITKKIWKLPNIIIFKLRCFNMIEGKGYKKNINLEITPIINLSNYFSKYSKFKNNNNYKLSSIVLHHGNNIDSGHYTTLKYIDKFNFIEYNDEYITEHNNLTKINNSYILFYEYLC